MDDAAKKDWESLLKKGLEDDTNSMMNDRPEPLDAGRSVFIGKNTSTTPAYAQRPVDKVIDFDVANNMPQITPNSKDLGMIQSIRFNLSKGKLTREHLTKCVELGFNTAFNHMVLQCSVQLSEANQQVVNEYLKRTAILRREVMINMRNEMISIANVYNDSLVEVATQRAEWKRNIQGLKARGLLSADEERAHAQKADDNMNGILATCEETSASIAATLMDQIKAALDIRVNDLTKITSKTSLN